MGNKPRQAVHGRKGGKRRTRLTVQVGHARQDLVDVIFSRQERLVASRQDRQSVDVEPTRVCRSELDQSSPTRLETLCAILTEVEVEHSAALGRSIDRRSEPLLCLIILSLRLTLRGRRGRDPTRGQIWSDGRVAKVCADS